MILSGAVHIVHCPLFGFICFVSNRALSLDRFHGQLYYKMEDFL